ncbi:MAG: SCO family protein [Pseudomonadales bacterium]
MIPAAATSAAVRPDASIRVCVLVWSVVLVLVLAAAGPVVAGEPAPKVHEHAEPVVLAPGYADLEFTAPQPGSYRLPPLGNAPDGRVLDEQGRVLSLHDLMGEGVVLLSFIYTTCSDVNGCPLATHVFNRVASTLAASRDLDGRVRLLSLSFDPDHDTPAVMRAYGAPYQRGGVDWRFLTTSGRGDLDPILDGYDQWVIRDVDAEGNPLGTISHLLRVYLIDASRSIRNIYSVSYLHADTIESDVRTLLQEAAAGD